MKLRFTTEAYTLVCSLIICNFLLETKYSLLAQYHDREATFGIKLCKMNNYRACQMSRYKDDRNRSSCVKDHNYKKRISHCDYIFTKVKINVTYMKILIFENVN